MKACNFDTEHAAHKLVGVTDPETGLILGYVCTECGCGPECPCWKNNCMKDQKNETRRMGKSDKRIFRIFKRLSRSTKR